MFETKTEAVLFFMFILVSKCERRIKDGSEVTVDRKYVVYLVKAPLSDEGYDTWLCGGAIVSSHFVVTSAACVNDVHYIYVIAGYKKYISDADIETDPCTSSMKKKVIFTCSPKGYDLKYKELDYWSFIDIALIKVESPFDFEDPKYETKCSYKPTTISINYEERYQEPGTDALVLGWGHTKIWRKPGDINNYNQESLRYSPTLLLDKQQCMERYKEYTNMSRVINTYMICSLGKGNIDDTGNTIQKTFPFRSGCTNVQEKVLGFEGISCEEESTEQESYDETDDDNRRHGKTEGEIENKTENKTVNVSSSDVNETRARRSGICQNDHGGPIVTWAGANEILIGVASVFKVSEEYECMGPYLYTSTVCTGLFLDCILSEDFPDKRRAARRYLCDRPANERGYDTIERTISWVDHPAGPAENEKIGTSAPKLAPSVEYSTNNYHYQPPNPRNVEDARSQQGFKSPSNMFQADTNPVIASSAHKERFKIKNDNPDIESSLVQDSVLSNIRQQETIFGTNNKNSANTNLGIIRYARKQMYTENKTILENESFPVVNGSHSDITIRRNNDTNSVTVSYSTKEEFLSPQTLNESKTPSN